MKPLVWLLPLLLAASDNALKVRLTSPRGGWSGQRVVAVSGSLSDRAVPAVSVGLNGMPFQLNTYRGRFEARLPVRPGLNTVEALASSAGQQARDRVSFFSTAPPTDLVVLLRWDTRGTDLDLRVFEPSGEECYHGHRHTASGGSLEVDDTDGYGPEIFLLPHAPLGEYRIAVAYYDAGAAPQSEAEVTVIVREGTPHERRYSFPITLTTDGETLDVGTFRVDRPLD